MVNFTQRDISCINIEDGRATFVIAGYDDKRTVRYFLINEHTGNAYTRYEQDEHWDELKGRDCEMAFALLDVYRGNIESAEILNDWYLGK